MQILRPFGDEYDSELHKRQSSRRHVSKLPMSMLCLVSYNGCTTEQKFAEELKRIQSVGEPQTPFDIQQVFWT